MPLDVAGVFDIECGAWTRFRVGEILDRDGTRYVSWDESDFFDALTARSGNYYAHNGGRYDIAWALGYAVKRRPNMRWNARTRGAGVLSVRLGQVELRDSFAICPMKLSTAAELSGKSVKLDFGLPCECERACGGYCVLDRELTARERRKVEAYLHGDCVALLDTLDAIEARAVRDDIDLRLTIGSTAWATARDWLGLPAATHALGRYGRLREGYYGGRVEVFRRRAPSGHRYDIHSSYPAALTRVSLPHGACVRHTSARAASRAYAAGREGVFGADVFVPHSMRIPPLPVRVPDRLLYPTGAISGTWTALELRYAESLGCVVRAVRWGYSWRESSPFLAPFAERVWSYRADAAASGEDAWAAWYKWIANSLTGKLAQNVTHTSLLWVPGDPPEFDPFGPPVDVALDDDAGAFVHKKTTRVDACAHVECSAYLTAEARIELHRQLMHAERPVYCDTDSVYARDELTRRIGPELGEWGYEGAMTHFRALAPKVYRYRCARCKKHPSGGWHVRGKGLPGLDARGFERLARGGTHRWAEGVEGLRSQVRKGGDLFVRRALARQLHPTPGWVGGREIESNGLDTRPTTLARYARRAKY